MSFSPEFLAFNSNIYYSIQNNSNNNLLSCTDAIATINLVLNNIYMICDEYHSVNNTNKHKLIRLLCVIYNKTLEFSTSTTCLLHARLFRKQAKIIAIAMDSLGYSTDATPLRRSNRLA